jgi:UDP-glucose 4-epimerase
MGNPNMKILLTGAFGNVGESTIQALLGLNHEITCLDIKTPRNEKLAKKLSGEGRIITVWGDIRDEKLVTGIMKDVGCIIHVAAILPPASERNAERTRSVNLEGTHTLIAAASRQVPKPRFIFTSSVSVHGPLMPNPPPRKASDSLTPSDNYTRCKVEAEQDLKASELPWVIVRLAMVPPLVMPTSMDPQMFEIPLEQRVEFVHTRDVGIALANAVGANVEKLELLIGGGKKCQMLYRDFIRKMLDASGIGSLPDAAFKIPKEGKGWYYVDWLDTELSQQLLSYQTRTLDDYTKELKRKFGIMRYLAKLFSPVVKKSILKQSPYYKDAVGKTR